MTSAKKSILKRILIVIIAALIAFSALSLIATKFIYDSIFVRFDAQATQYPTSLMDMITNREKKEYACGDNLLTGYLYRSEADERDTLVVLAPGYRASVDDYIWQISSLLNYGWSVFAFDTTGSCTSEGESAIGFPQVVRDMEATLKYLENHDRLGYNEIALLGHSRGGYAACCALGYDYDIAAVISISGINSAMEGVIGSATEYVGPLAYGNYGFLWLYQTMLFGADSVNQEASKEISDSDVPVLIVHGSSDAQVPIDRYSILSHRDEIRAENVEYLLCSNPNQDGHTNLLFDADGQANRELMQEIHSFLVKATDQ